MAGQCGSRCPPPLLHIDSPHPCPISSSCSSSCVPSSLGYTVEVDVVQLMWWGLTWQRCFVLVEIDVVACGMAGVNGACSQCNVVDGA